MVQPQNGDQKMDLNKIYDRYIKYVESCKKICEDADVSLGRNRVERIKAACRSKVFWEERDNLKTLGEQLNLTFCLVYREHIQYIIPEKIKLFDNIPKG